MSPRSIIRSSVALGLLVPAAVWVLPEALQAQETFRACYVPGSGVVYRIGVPDGPSECRSPRHVEFSWTSGVPGLDHGNLNGLGDDDHPQYILVDGVRDATDGFAVTGTRGTGTIPVEGEGTRLMWYPGKGAFRAGFGVSGTWDDANVGELSTAMGSGTTASGNFSTALGVGTTARGIASTAMGRVTTATDIFATAVGNATTASGPNATAMGRATTASGQVSTAMGDETEASGIRSTAMGQLTTASGNRSTAMGFHANTNNQVGSFVYGDASSTSDVTAPTNNSFTVRASGGTTFYSNSALTAGVHLAPGGGSWASLSDRNRKRDFRDEDGEEVLSEIADMPIQSWSYEAQDPSIRHLGPTAQDFYAAFDLGQDEETITTTDIDGVNMLAIQALERRTENLRTETSELRAENEKLRSRYEELVRRLDRLESQSTSRR